MRKTVTLQFHFQCLRVRIIKSYREGDTAKKKNVCKSDVCGFFKHSLFFRIPEISHSLEEVATSVLVVPVNILVYSLVIF